MYNLPQTLIVYDIHLYFHGLLGGSPCDEISACHLGGLIAIENCFEGFLRVACMGSHRIIQKVRCQLYFFFFFKVWTPKVGEYLLEVLIYKHLSTGLIIAIKHTHSVFEQISLPCTWFSSKVFAWGVMRRSVFCSHGLSSYRQDNCSAIRALFISLNLKSKLPLTVIEPAWQEWMS